MSPGFRQMWRKQHQRNVTVPCRPLMDIVDDGRSAGFTYLSLDVEGAEEMVLRTLDMAQRFPFSVVLVEINREGKGRQLTASTLRVKTMLNDTGLVELHIGKVPGSENAVFARPELGDPRRIARPPDAAIMQVKAAVVAARPWSQWSTVNQSHMGGPNNFAVRAAQSLLQACAMTQAPICRHRLPPRAGYPSNLDLY